MARNVHHPWKRNCNSTVTLLIILGPTPALHAADFDIITFGTTSNDASDDTLAIRATLEACGKAGGGTVFVQKGVFIVSRQKSETPILSIPTKTRLYAALAPKAR